MSLVGFDKLNSHESEGPYDNNLTCGALVASPVQLNECVSWWCPSLTVGLTGCAFGGSAAVNEYSETSYQLLWIHFASQGPESE